jgi:hypothetical protein
MLNIEVQQVMQGRIDEDLKEALNQSAQEQIYLISNKNLDIEFPTIKIQSLPASLSLCGSLLDKPLTNLELTNHVNVANIQREKATNQEVVFST